MKHSGRLICVWYVFQVNMFFRRSPSSALDHISAPMHAVLLLKKLSQAAREDRDLEIFATFVHHCLVINDQHRPSAEELIKECLSWGNSSQDI